MQVQAQAERFGVKEIWIILGLFLAIFVTGADSFIISPLLPALSQYFHTQISQVAYGVTIYAGCYALGCPFWGPLGDRFQKKRLLMVGMLIFLLGTILCGLASELYQFYLFRGIAGIGASLLVPNIWAFVGTTFKRGKLGIVMGIVMSALSLSIAIGVPLGSFLAQLTDWHMAFWGSAGLTIIAFGLLMMTVPATGATNRTKINYWQNFVIVKNTPNALVALTTTLVWMFGFYILYTFLGSFLAAQFHFNTAQSGYVFIVYGLSNFVASFFGGFLNNRIGIPKSIIVNGLLSVIVILLISGLGRTLLWMIIGLVLLAFFQGVGVSALNTFIVNVVPSNRSTVMSFNSSFLYLGLTLGSLVGGLIFQRFGFSMICFAAAIGILLAVLNIKRLQGKEQ